MVGAMVVVLCVVAVYAGWQALNGDDDQVQTPTVDYSSWVRAGRAEGRLQIMVPASMPNGWRATSASYTSGISPHWHLGALTADNHYVGIEEGLEPVRAAVHQHVDANARRARSVVIGGQTWQAWTDSGGDYAVARQLRAPKGHARETLLVVSSAPPARVRSYVASLRGVVGSASSG